jgi:hypothetical protein
VRRQSCKKPKSEVKIGVFLRNQASFKNQVSKEFKFLNGLFRFPREFANLGLRHATIGSINNKSISSETAHNPAVYYIHSLNPKIYLYPLHSRPYTMPKPAQTNNNLNLT